MSFLYQSSAVVSALLPAMKMESYGLLHTEFGTVSNEGFPATYSKHVRTSIFLCLAPISITSPEVITIDQSIRVIQV